MNEKMTKGAAVPLYQQVMDNIRGEIEAGTYAPGSQIPTELELAEAYQVGRVTVRRAIEELVYEGYLTKQQGRGTFVNAPKLVRKVRQEADVQSFSEACRVNGMRPTSRLISRHVVPVSKEMAAFLGLEEGADLLAVVRLRMADGVPVMFENNYFPYEEFKFLEQENLGGSSSIFEVVRAHTGRYPENSGDCTVEIARADQETASYLSVPAGEPLFFMKVDFLDGAGQPFFIGRQYIVGSRFIFSI